MLVALKNVLHSFQVEVGNSISECCASCLTTRDDWHITCSMRELCACSFSHLPSDTALHLIDDIIIFDFWDSQQERQFRQRSFGSQVVAKYDPCFAEYGGWCVQRRYRSRLALANIDDDNVFLNRIFDNSTQTAIFTTRRVPCSESLENETAQAREVENTSYHLGL